MSDTHDLSEIWKQLRTDLLADSGLTGLLGGADAIYRELPQTRVTFPAIIIEDRSSNPANASFTGKYSPDLQIDILSDSDYTNRAISGYLQANWAIPLNRTTEVSSTNFRITELHHVNDLQGSRLQLTDTDEIIRHLVSEWRARVVKKTA